MRVNNYRESRTDDSAIQDNTYSIVYDHIQQQLNSSQQQNQAQNRASSSMMKDVNNKSSGINTSRDNTFEQHSENTSGGDNFSVEDIPTKIILLD